jgi:hypothetical protein
MFTRLRERIDPAPTSANDAAKGRWNGESLFTPSLGTFVRLSCAMALLIERNDR